MAKMIERDIQSQEISDFYPLWKVVIIGAASGLLFLLLTFLREKFVISPLFCNTIGDATACTSALLISGNIASVLVALAGIVVMVKLKMVQPLIVAVTTTAALWGLAQWTSGLSVLEAIVWSISTYLVSYLLFSWIVRYDRIWPVVVIILIIVMAVRIAANL